MRTGSAVITECVGCGVSFKTSDVRKRYCRKGCGRVRATRNDARTARRAAHAITFAGVDGEGVTRPDGRHDYVMLSVGQETLTDHGHELDPWHICEFLWENRNAAAALTGFYLGYDFTQMFKHLPEPTARELFTAKGQASRARTRSGGNPTPFPVRWEGWELDILADRRLRIRPQGSREPWAYVCDAGPFWQTGFLAAVDPAGWPDGPVCTEAEFAIIAEGKGRRAVAELDPAMIRYNHLENEIMSRLMGRLNDGLVAMGLQLDRDQWYGPGQAAGKWLNGKVPGSARIGELVPRDVLQAARASFYGGWFEIFAHGHVGDLAESDLNSAYPKAISELPCLEHGHWERFGPGRLAGVSGFSLVLASVFGSDPHIGAMLHREADGTICRPQETRGWFWVDEVRAAADAGLIDYVDVDHGWEYVPCNCPPPLAAIADLYGHRLAVGKNTAAGKAAKLIYNSAFGKLAQSVGNPRWANPIYASRITSVTRTAILRAVQAVGTREVAMIATDGIYTFTEVPGLQRSETELGAWDSAVKRNACLHMPGVYWDDATREKLAAGSVFKLASRGVSARDLAKGLDELDRRWGAFDGSSWPTVRVPLDFSMITARQALARNRWELAGHVRTDDTKTLSGDPVTKRRDPYRDGVFRTRPYGRGTTLDSVPYDGTLGMPPDITTPDGPIGMLLAGMLR